MKTRTIALSLCLLPVFALAEGEFVLVRDGAVFPPLAVATMADISSNAVAALAAAQAAGTASNAAAEVGLIVDGVEEIVNSLEGVGYIRGHLLDFGVSETSINTNATVNIVKFVPGVSNDVAHAYCDVYAYFEEEPASLPVIRWTGSLKTDPATWTELESVETELTTTMVGATEYECYRIRVAVPIENSAAFYRVFAEATQSSVGAFLPVRNGIRVGGREPLTGEFNVGTNVYKFVGGVRVQ